MNHESGAGSREPGAEEGRDNQMLKRASGLFVCPPILFYFLTKPTREPPHNYAISWYGGKGVQANHKCECCQAQWAPTIIIALQLEVFLSLSFENSSRLVIKQTVRRMFVRMLLSIVKTRV